MSSEALLPASPERTPVLLPRYEQTFVDFEDDNQEQNHHTLKMFNGVIIPCTLHMMGILFFLKIDWAVGQAGWVNTLM